MACTYVCKYMFKRMTQLRINVWTELPKSRHMGEQLYNQTQSHMQSSHPIECICQASHPTEYICQSSHLMVCIRQSSHPMEYICQSSHPMNAFVKPLTLWNTFVSPLNLWNTFVSPLTLWNAFVSPLTLWNAFVNPLMHLLILSWICQSSHPVECICQSSHPMEYICQSTTAYTRWPPKCSTTTTIQDRQRCIKTHLCVRCQQTHPARCYHLFDGLNAGAIQVTAVLPIFHKPATITYTSSPCACCCF